MSKSRRVFSKEFKAKVVLDESLRGTKQSHHETKQVHSLPSVLHAQSLRGTKQSHHKTKQEEF